MIAEKIQTAPTPEIAKDVIAVGDLFDGLVGLVEGVSDFVDSPLSFIYPSYLSLSQTHAYLPTYVVPYEVHITVATITNIVAINFLI